eukprot:6212432-Pleurochrysis_carterae.AAC.4
MSYAKRAYVGHINVQNGWMDVRASPSLVVRAFDSVLGSSQAERRDFDPGTTPEEEGETLKPYYIFWGHLHNRSADADTMAAPYFHISRFREED